jgi:hypothetical protein
MTSAIFVPFLENQNNKFFEGRQIINSRLTGIYALKENVLMIRQSGQVVNKSSFIRIEIRGILAYVRYGLHT